MMFKQILLSITVLFIIYIFLIEPNILTVKRLTLKSDEIKNIKIVFVSDFHLSKYAEKRLDRIIKKVNSEYPDIIISGGDYVINHSAKASMDIDLISKKISGMKSKYGIYSVLGNHDYYEDWIYIRDNLKKYGINIIENSNYKLKIKGQTLYIAGISDMQTTHIDINKALSNTKRPIIFVSHSPDVTPLVKNRVNLILSGHTHGGQIRIPFYGAVIVPSKYGKKYESGFIDNIVYVTKGLGTSIIKARFNCFPEITVIEFE